VDDVVLVTGLLDDDFFHNELRLRHIGSRSRRGDDGVDDEEVFSVVETSGRCAVVRRRSSEPSSCVLM